MDQNNLSKTHHLKLQIKPLFSIKTESLEANSERKKNSSSLPFGKELYQNIKSLNTFQRLRIQFSRDSGCVDKIIKAIKSKKNRFINELTIEFQESFTMRHIKRLGEALKYLSSIKSLNLVFEGYFYPGQLKIILNQLKQTSCIKNLNIKYGSSYKKEKDIKYISKFIRSLSTLNSFSCEMKSENSDKGIIMLSAGFRTLYYLKNLSMKIKSDKQFERELISFRDNMKNLRNLRTISINFSSSRIINYQFSQFLQFLSNLKSLETIDMNCDSCWVEDDGIKSIQSLCNLPHLRALHLNLANCMFITDEGLVLLSDTLTRLNQLQHLSLAFGTYNDINEGEFSNLGKAIGTLNNLKRISLIFYRCLVITEKNLEDFIENLSRLKSLEYLHWNFGGNSKAITEHNVNNLKRAIDSLPLLKKASCHSRDCSETIAQLLVKLNFDKNVANT